VTTRESERVDYYEVLGLGRDATQHEIVARFRALARTLHPDRRPVDRAAIDEFKRVTSAYRVLGDVQRRRRYDATRVAMPRPAAPPAPAHSPPPRAPRLTRRGARWAVIGGIGCFVFGLVAAALVVALQRHDAALRADGITATATVVEVGGERRLEFTTAEGDEIRAKEPLKSGTGRPPVGSQVEIVYDRDDPTSVISNESQLARDITLWIVAIKLLVGGAILVAVGVHRLHRTRG
jgi:DnaJ-like protein/uncharacterized protein DUF3592